MIFFTGINNLTHAEHVDYSFISINRLSVTHKRIADFECKTWVMDSGAFTQVFKTGDHALSPLEYAKEIKRWSRCGILVRAVAQDYMCEDFILKKYNRTAGDHQRMTTRNYVELLEAMALIQCDVPIMPVLQGYEPAEYANHVKAYGSLLKQNAWVGVGSICKRNSNPASVAEVLNSILEVRPDLRLHGFGIKKTCLQDSLIRDRLFSADSMAWDFACRYEKRKATPYEANIYKNRIEKMPVQTNFIY